MIVQAKRTYNIKITRKTHQQLKLITGMTDETLVALLERVVEAEFRRAQAQWEKEGYVNIILSRR